MNAVERIDPPSADEFLRRYVRRHRPVVIAGAMGDWPAMTAWQPDTLVERFGDRMVPIAKVEDRRVVNDPRIGIPYREQSLRSCISELRGEGGRVDGYAMVLLAQTLTELVDDVRVPSFAPAAPWSMYKFWLSAADTRSPLHMDLPDNLLAQVVGRKRITLYSPWEELRMYRHPPWSRLPQVSRVDSIEPDHSRFPRFASARAWQCEIGPGDMLFIPRFWWHQVRSLDFSVSVNHWWATGWVWWGVRTALAYQRLRQLRF